MSSSRRTFMRRALAAAVVGIGWGRSRAGALDSMTSARRGPHQGRPDEAPPSPGALPVVVSTWGFSLPGNERARDILSGGGSALDAVEQGIRLVESFPHESSVGLGGIPNADGVVQLDACIMGPEYRAGSVAALEGILHPITAARRVMEHTPHVMLVGAGAREFAIQQGLEQGDLLTEERRRAWERWRARRQRREPTHDTVAMLAVDAQGHLAGGCSTSGWGYKMPGRVGDSPIIGAGLYVDHRVGAAGATGLGEIVMRHCGSFMVVEFMRQGMDPQAACTEAVRRIVEREPAVRRQAVNFVAVDLQGRHGASGTSRGFRYNVTTTHQSGTLGAHVLGESQLMPRQFRRR